MSKTNVEPGSEVRIIASRLETIAKRMNGQFVLDPVKAQDFAQAIENRQKRKAGAARSENGQIGFAIA